MLCSQTPCRKQVVQLMLLTVALSLSEPSLGKNVVAKLLATELICGSSSISLFLGLYKLPVNLLGAHICGQMLHKHEST